MHRTDAVEECRPAAANFPSMDPEKPWWRQWRGYLPGTSPIACRVRRPLPFARLRWIAAALVTTGLAVDGVARGEPVLALWPVVTILWWSYMPQRERDRVLGRS